MKHVLVAGATSAIAIACARLWAAQGAFLFLAARDTAKLEATAGDLRVRGAAKVHVHRMAGLEVADHHLLLESALAEMGRIDVALIAWGTLPDQGACERDASVALRESFTNGTSVISLLTLLANRLESQGAGAIGVITSVAGDRGRPSNYVYGSAKKAVSTFCEGLRARLSRSGVTLTDIRPGFVASPMTAGLALPGPLVSQPARIADRIVKGIERGNGVLYVPAYWALIMLVVRSIPSFIFNKLKL